jgi:enoyl-CoA hydratase
MVMPVPDRAGGAKHPLIAIDADDGVAVVRLDDPAHRNAISYELSRQLADAIHSIGRDEAVGALVVTASPPVFSAGGSLDDLESPPGPLSEVYAGLVALASCPLPTVAAVAGPAVGAGVNVALACDVILASPAAVFDCRFLDIGIHPGGGHLWQLRQRIGRQGAAALVLLGDTLSGQEAERHGLAWRCVHDDELVPLALQLARRAARRPGPVVRRTKATLDESTAITTSTGAVELERVAQEWSMQQPEFAEGVARARRRVKRSTQPGEGGR